MKTNGGFLVTKIKQLGDRILRRFSAKRISDAFNGAQGAFFMCCGRRMNLDQVTLSQMRISDNISYDDAGRMENQGLISRVQSETDKRKPSCF